MNKKLISTLLVVCVVMAIMATAAFAANVDMIAGLETLIGQIKGLFTGIGSGTNFSALFSALLRDFWDFLFPNII